MIQLIVGGKGSGKTKKMIDMINDSAKTTPGNIVCIEKSMKLTYDIDHAARLIDVDEYKISGYDMLYGFIAGILVGIVFLKKGFSLQRSYRQMKAEGAAFPLVLVGLYVVYLLFKTAFKASEEGPGSMHAAIGVALAIGVIVGILCQRSRMCMVGGIRNAVMFKDFGLVAGFVTIILTVLVGNLILGKFNPGFTGQPVAHNDGLWNFLGTALMGWGCVLLGGCPLRQLILAGQGESDSAVTVLGMMCGAAFCHNLKLASSADGPTGNGKIAVIVGFVVVLVVSLLFTKKAEE